MALIIILLAQKICNKVVATLSQLHVPCMLQPGDRLSVLYNVHSSNKVVSH